MDHVAENVIDPVFLPLDSNIDPVGRGGIIGADFIDDICVLCFANNEVIVWRIDSSGETEGSRIFIHPKKTCAFIASNDSTWCVPILFSNTQMRNQNSPPLYPLDDWNKITVTSIIWRWFESDEFLIAATDGFLYESRLANSSSPTPAIPIIQVSQEPLTHAVRISVSKPRQMVSIIVATPSSVHCFSGTVRSGFFDRYSSTQIPLTSVVAVAPGTAQPLAQTNYFPGNSELSTPASPLVPPSNLPFSILQISEDQTRVHWVTFPFGILELKVIPAIGIGDHSSYSPAGSNATPSIVAARGIRTSLKGQSATELLASWPDLPVGLSFLLPERFPPCFTPLSLQKHPSMSGTGGENSSLVGEVHRMQSFAAMDAIFAPTEYTSSPSRALNNTVMSPPLLYPLENCVLAVSGELILSVGRLSGILLPDVAPLDLTGMGDAVAFVPVSTSPGFVSPIGCSVVVVTSNALVGLRVTRSISSLCDEAMSLGIFDEALRLSASPGGSQETRERVLGILAMEALELDKYMTAARLFAMSTSKHFESVCDIFLTAHANRHDAVRRLHYLANHASGPRTFADNLSLLPSTESLNEGDPLKGLIIFLSSRLHQLVEVANPSANKNPAMRTSREAPPQQTLDCDESSAIESDVEGELDDEFEEDTPEPSPSLSNEIPRPANPKDGKHAPEVRNSKHNSPPGTKQSGPTRTNKQQRVSQAISSVSPHLITLVSFLVSVSVSRLSHLYSRLEGLSSTRAQLHLSSSLHPLSTIFDDSNNLLASEYSKQYKGLRRLLRRVRRVSELRHGLLEALSIAPPPSILSSRLQQSDLVAYFARLQGDTDSEVLVHVQNGRWANAAEALLNALNRALATQMGERRHEATSRNTNRVAAHVVRFAAPLMAHAAEKFVRICMHSALANRLHELIPHILPSIVLSVTIERKYNKGASSNEHNAIALARHFIFIQNLHNSNALASRHPVESVESPGASAPVTMKGMCSDSTARLALLSLLCSRHKSLLNSRDSAQKSPDEQISSLELYTQLLECEDAAISLLVESGALPDDFANQAANASAVTLLSVTPDNTEDKTTLTPEEVALIANSGMQKAWLLVQTSAGLGLDAIKTALSSQDWETARRLAMNVRNPRTKRLMWLQMLSAAAKDEFDGPDALLELCKSSGGAVNERDVLRHVHDVSLVESLRPQIIQVLEAEESKIVRLNTTLEQLSASSIHLLSDIRRAESRALALSGLQVCELCRGPAFGVSRLAAAGVDDMPSIVLSGRVYVFPCGHVSHAACLERQIFPTLTKEEQRAYLRVKKELEKAFEEGESSDGQVRNLTEALDATLGFDCAVCGQLLCDSAVSSMANLNLEAGGEDPWKI